MTEPRYRRNFPALTEEETALLGKKRVLVAGCGGLGGYVLEELARAGVGSLVPADGDCFDETNLNRQLLCTPELLGTPKAWAAVQRLRRINPGIEALPIFDRIQGDNVRRFIQGCDVAVDALDTIWARLLLEDACGEAGVPMVHGAVSGWRLQAAVVLPGTGRLRKLYSNTPEDTDTPGVPAFTPAVCASIQAAETVKLLCGREAALSGRLLTMDLQTMESAVIPL